MKHFFTKCKCMVSLHCEHSRVFYGDLKL
uniref:Uncharacterized protein n=1 Tax=Anguilla anguilla TaxID=7936 RepID=A0A0E9XDV8_ANGAN